ncbi:MAG: hypothetical protein KKI08_28155 [Armatimonadetes bacterium]|nr:hypothetical protein [Armatimonadota bacterium]
MILRCVHEGTPSVTVGSAVHLTDFRNWAAHVADFIAELEAMRAKAGPQTMLWLYLHQQGIDEPYEHCLTGRSR